MKITAKTFVKLTVLGMSWTIVYTLAFIQYILYDPFLESIGCTNAQLGLLMTIFGLGNVLGAPVGGWLADRFDYKKIYVGSLIVNGVLPILFANSMNYGTAIVIWIGLAVGALVMNYPSHIKIVRMLADDSNQGKIFGLNESFVGITGIVLNAILLFAFAKFGEGILGVKAVIYIIGIVSILCAIASAFILKDVGKGENFETKEKKEKITGKDYLTILRSPATWLIGLGIFSVYSCAVSMSYFTPYFTAVIGGTVAISGALSLIRTYALRLVGAPLGGWLCDKTKSVSKVLLVVYGIGIAIQIVFIGFVSYISAAVFILLTLVIGTIVYMGKGSYYALATELKVPRRFSASTIGIAAALGFSPDIFMFALAGHWIDKYGNDGYRYIFIFQMIIFIVGILGCLYALRYRKKLESQPEEIAV